MKPDMRKILCLLAGLFACTAAIAQHSFDKTVHDFGDVLLEDGPLSCTFSVKNDSDRPLTIKSVVSSCGCTGVKWTRTPIAAGESGQISAEYSNDEGAYPFNKTLTVYLSDSERPVILHIRGDVHEKKKNLAETYPAHFGTLAMKSNSIKVGNMRQGERKSGIIDIANTGKKPVRLDLADISEGLTLNIDNNVIAPSGISHLSYTVQADRTKWGRTSFGCSFIINGRKTTGPEFRTTIIKNFSGMDRASLSEAPVAELLENTWTVQKLKEGQKIEARFVIRNGGRKTLKIYGADSEDSRLRFRSYPEAVAPGADGEIAVEVRAENLEKGEQLFIGTLYTNSPTRPLVNIFVTGYLK